MEMSHVRTIVLAFYAALAASSAISQHSAGLDIRRADRMNPEDPLVLEWLKAVQDYSSSDHRLLPAQEGDNAAQTFNNSLAALAFMVKNERERAERILDFYARATVPENIDSTLQNFFFKGEARGFFQEVSLSTYHNIGHGNDRWMGDMAWLLCAYKYYEREYHSTQYARITSLLHDLLVSYYKPAAHGGYIQHGWRKSDTYKHEADGHHEGNIDCHAVMRLCREDSLAHNIKLWIDSALTDLHDLPLDLYTWRTMAYGPTAASLLDVPENDTRYRKSISLRGHNVTGFYHGPDPAQKNIWTDGLGHIACAYLTCGDAAKGRFYANQLDSMIVESRIGGRITHTIPYTATRSGGYEWVDTLKGFTSCAAWYILAKNAVNPFQPAGAGRGAADAAAERAVLKMKIGRIAEQARARVGVAVTGYERDDTLTFNGKERYPMFSVFKLPIVLAVLDRVDKGELSLESKIHVKKKELRRRTWSPLRRKYGRRNVDITVDELIRYTISLSDNNGSDILMRVAGGPRVVGSFVHTLGIRDITITASAEKIFAEDSLQYNNWSTPAAMADLLNKLSEGKILSPKSTKYLWETMAKTRTGHARIKGLLPEGTVVAHKTGSSGTTRKGTTMATNDVGYIVLPDGKQVTIAVFVADAHASEGVCESTIAEIARAVWDTYVKR
jgi:beta-lactamase class A